MLTRSWMISGQAGVCMPSGVNSPVRSFGAVGGQPLIVERAAGARLWDVDGNEYLDYICSWGPAILGHAHPKVVAAIRAAAEQGTSFGLTCPLEVKMAGLVCSLVPSVQRVRMTNSGTEACMTAVRLARGYTRRDKIIKFAGCYHGHSDSLLVKAGSGALTFGHPDSAGVPADFAKHTLVLPFNEPDAVQAAFDAHGREIAAVIVEPVPGNAGLYLPKPGYLEFLRKITQEHGALLIFDEVMTGFRLAPGGAQERFGVRPDLTTLGKIIGGGLPVGAVGGRAEVMDFLAPLGPVYQAGTLSGNPLAMAAGIATIEELCGSLSASGHGDNTGEKQKRGKGEEERGAHEGKFSSSPFPPSPPAAPPAYARLEHLGAALEAGLRDAARLAGVPVTLNRCGSMLCLYLTPGPVWNLADAMRSNLERFKTFFRSMLELGVLLPPSQFESWFISTAHTESDIEMTVRAASAAFKKL
ncbi:MAG: glutamate-1-semialdehyde 2,1-aminomutase [Verrucomicrobiae bacterium]|nr:glutamate-1-semialdehyde 2,1-aminomutase [Verrucomicrobiae bacterium]